MRRGRLIGDPTLVAQVDALVRDSARVAIANVSGLATLHRDDLARATLIEALDAGTARFTPGAQLGHVPAGAAA